jgi:hypothetical protein
VHRAACLHGIFTASLHFAGAFHYGFTGSLQFARSIHDGFTTLLQIQENLKDDFPASLHFAIISRIILNIKPLFAEVFINDYHACGNLFFFVRIKTKK